MRSIFAAFVAALVLAAAAPADAAPPARSPEKAATDVRARELFQKGDKDYSEGRYEEANAAFQEAYDLSGRAQLLFNISNALERLGRYNDAIEALDKYLASGKVKDKDIVQKRIANLRKRVEEQKAADDKAKEEEDKKRADELKAAEDAAAKAEAERQKAAKPPPPPPTRVLPFVLLGVGGAALVGSGVFGLLTLSARSDVDAGCKDGAAGKLCSGAASSAIDRDKTFSVVTDIAFVSGLVLGGVGAYLLIAGGKTRIEARPAGLGATVVGTF